MSLHKRLDELKAHQCAVVDHIEAEDEEMSRLMAMGVCTGRTIELVKSGDPLILKVFGSRIGVSARLARRVRVTPYVT
jgi:Fe2+ transport system protein FeoA